MERYGTEIGQKATTSGLSGQSLWRNKGDHTPRSCGGALRQLSSRPAIVRLSAFVALAAVLGGCQEKVRWENPARVRVLVDNVHSRKANPSYELNRKVYAYQHNHGYHRLFQNLDRLGFESRRFMRRRIDGALLKEVQVLFLNLPDDSRPGFRDSEIEAIEQFVKLGGGLFVIADHSNCYHHAEMLNPLVSRFGIEIMLATAADNGKSNVIEGNGWLWAERIAPHPVSQGVRAFSLQTGGPFSVDEETTVLATTSPAGWADSWDPENDKDTGGFYGNWKHDKGEKKGRLPVVVAREYGKGRIVAIGDQNALGNMWLHYADNLRLALNAFRWLAKKPPPEQVLPPAKLTMSIDEGEGVTVGSKKHYGFYSLFGNFNRMQGVLAMAHRQPTWSDADVLTFLMPRNTSGRAHKNIREQLQRGKTVLWVASAPHSTADRKLFEEYQLPTPMMSGSVNDLDAAYTNGLRQAGTTVEWSGPLAPGAMAPPGTRNIVGHRPHVLLSSNLKEPGGGTRVVRNIAQYRRAGGDLVIWFPGALLSNAFMGCEEDQSDRITDLPRDIGYRLTEWLRDRTPAK